MNSLFEIYPYRNKQGTWKFDDEATGLIAEPFVGETNTLIDKMVEDAGMTISEASKGVKYFPVAPEKFYVRVEEGHR